ncbi:MAG: hypothetical protein ACH34Y_09295, partial [Brachymonas sp.]
MKLSLLFKQSAGSSLSQKLGLVTLLFGLSLAVFPAHAQTTVANIASAQPPAGTVNTNLGADGSGKVSATDTDSVTIPPQISLAKTASANPFIIGKAGQYYDITVTVASGPTTAAINITDSLPTGITLSSAPTKEAGSSSNGV